jgi:hypothetical protein
MNDPTLPTYTEACTMLKAIYESQKPLAIAAASRPISFVFEVLDVMSEEGGEA